MLFNSFSFLLFLCAVLVLHHLPLPWRVKKFNLLIASYFFYAAWNPPFVLLLVASTLTDWFIGRWIYRTASPRGRRVLLGMSLLVNLGMLGFFKYGTFFLEQFIVLGHMFGVEFSPAAPDIVLPVGISFYTFQTLSYTLDIYFGKVRPWHSFLDYALYVTFFCQLVAGPIVRAAEFLPQCTVPRRASWREFAWGLNLLVLGLFQKIVVADGLLAPVADVVFRGDGIRETPSAWCGTLAFAGQIFCDFSGYSSCAIGIGLCLGFSLPDNFRFPYAAIGFSDFWRRWHISLSTWLRDYLYVPLGGNRRGTERSYVNLMITMLLGGLWHGAAWTYVFWGALHGAYLVAERWLRLTRLAQAAIWQANVGKCMLSVGTFLLVCFAWVFFRAESFETAFGIAGAMLGYEPLVTHKPLDRAQLLTGSVPAIVIVVLHWYLRETTLEAVAGRLPAWVWSLATALMLAAIVVVPGEERAFIYFQF